MGALLKFLFRRDDTPMLGTTNGTSALIGFLVTKYPHNRVFLFPFPISLKFWVIGAIFMFTSLADLWSSPMR